MYSPGYPANYPNNINYTWTLVSGSNDTILIFTIVDLQTKRDGNLSCFDYLTIERVDVFPCCNVVFKGCHNYTNSVVAEGKQFRVSFKTDNLVSRKGFNISWQANASVQIRNRYYIEYLDGKNGQITSLGYPCSYPNNLNYAWILKTGNNKTRVNFDILDVQAETLGDSSCFDYLKIDRIEPCCATLTKVCRNLTQSIAAEGGRFRVSFISDGSVTKKGFRLVWKVFSPWKNRDFQSITQSFDVTTQTTAYKQKDTKTSEGDMRTEYSVFPTWKTKDFPAITQSFDATTRTTAYEQKDIKTSESDKRTENSVFTSWRTRGFPAITKSFDVTPRTTAYEQKDVKTSEGDEGTENSDTKTSEDDRLTENSSLYRLLFIVSCGCVAILLLVILCIVMYYKKKIQRKCSPSTSTYSPDSLGDDNNTIYENVASYELRRRADNNCQNNSAEEEMYTQLMF